jgi:hypothetical protein
VAATLLASDSEALQKDLLRYSIKFGMAMAARMPMMAITYNHQLDQCETL